MHEQPSQLELVEAVKRFISDTAMPQLSGRAAFHARVALNVLDILSRDLANRADNEQREEIGLRIYLEGYDHCMTLEELNELLCSLISTGGRGADDPDLIELLKDNAIAQIEVDQPKYSGLKTALKNELKITDRKIELK